MCSDTDPRLSDEFIRRPSTRVTLVGVVHDHPASVHRVRQTVLETGPDVLALELPPLAVPLFREYADDNTTPPAFGGEMSAAIQAADVDRVVGIDGPTLAFAGRLARRLVAEDHSRSTARTVARSLGHVTKHACVCRLAATLSRFGGVTVRVDQPVDHDCSMADDPDTQATDEHNQVRRARTVMNAFGPQPASAVRKRTREMYMTDRLASLAADDSVLAVVGAGHLGEVADGLAEY